MLYISKGIVLNQKSKTSMLRVASGGTDYVLTGVRLRLWSDGRRGINETENEREVRHLFELQKLGLIELSEDVGAVAIYRLLTRCIICPTKLRLLYKPLTTVEKQVLQWIDKAGLRLTIGELTKLSTEGIYPSIDLLGKENAQELVLKIYADNFRFDTSPDIQMEQSPKRDDVVNAVLGLLKKERIFLI